MKFAVTSEHHDYFLAHQAIEFEELLTPTQLKQLQDGVLSVLGQRMGGKRALLDKATADEHFIIGRDLWKDSAAIRKIVTHVRLATLAAELVDEKTLRLGYDTYLPAPEIPLSSNDFPDPFHRLLLESRPLSTHWSIQGVVCGLMLCLKGSGESQEKLTVFSRQPGHGVFFSPDYPIEYPELYQRRGHAYLLIVYAKSNSVYIRQEDDPQDLAFKAVGYTLGDKLKDKWNPIIYRSYR